MPRDFIDDYLDLKRKVRSIGASRYDDVEVLNLVPLLNPGFYGDHFIENGLFIDHGVPDLYIVKKNGICTMYGFLYFAPDRTPADIAAFDYTADPLAFLRVESSNAYEGHNIIGTNFGNTVGITSPQVDLGLAGTGPEFKIPPEFCPPQTINLTVPFNWQNTGDGFSHGTGVAVRELDLQGRFMQLIFKVSQPIFGSPISDGGSLFTYNSLGPRPVCTYDDGTIVKGIPGGGVGSLQFDTISYVAGELVSEFSDYNMDTQVT